MLRILKEKQVSRIYLFLSEVFYLYCSCHIALPFRAFVPFEGLCGENKCLVVLKLPSEIAVCKICC